jgi:hypothetical protein
VGFAAAPERKACQNKEVYDKNSADYSHIDSLSGITGIVVQPWELTRILFKWHVVHNVRKLHSKVIAYYTVCCHKWNGFE